MEKARSPQFEKLINPLSPNIFWTDIFEKKDCFFESEIVKLEFDLVKFENLLWAFEEVLDKKVQLNHQGNNIELHRKTEGKDWFRTCLDNYHDGATIIFNGIDEIDPDTARFARAIDKVFNGKTTVNAFLTPPGSHGFLPHFDTHDVFILQTDGEKHWELFQKEIELPIDRQMYLIDQKKLVEKQTSYHLTKNNVLYIPRGKVHSAFTTDTYSLHLTIGVRPPLAADYYKSLLEVATENNADFRRSIQYPEGTFAAAQRKRLLKNIADIEKEAATSEVLQNKMDIKFVSGIRPLPGFHLKGIHEANQIVQETRVEKAVESFALSEDGDRINLYYPGAGLAGDENIQPGYFSLPAAAKQAMDFILQNDGHFTPNDLPAVYPGETRLAIIKRLVVEGFLRIS